MARDEVTGKKPRITIGSDEREDGPPAPFGDPDDVELAALEEFKVNYGEKKPRARGPPRGAYTIPQFCAAHGFSQAMYFKEKAAGRGPVEMKVGTRRLISVEAAARWRRERERTTRSI